MVEVLLISNESSRKIWTMSLPLVVAETRIAASPLPSPHDVPLNEKAEQESLFWVQANEHPDWVLVDQK